MSEPDSKPTTEVYGVNNACSEFLRQSGKPYPRTCRACGLGPCRNILDHERMKADAQSKTTTRHTPGTWIWRGKSGSLHRIGTDGYRYGAVVLEPVHEYESGTDTKIGDADAALIEAAPDMLAALKWARTCVPYPSDCHAAIVPAIDKAEGAINHG